MERFDRRSLLRAAGAGAALTVSGCLDAMSGGPKGVVLPPPEDYELLRRAELPYPIHGEKLPDVTVQDPLNDVDVSTMEFEGERHVLLTLFFSRCTQTCPTLVSNLVQVQAEAAAGGWSDEVMLLAITFDPEHDTEPVLREYAETMNVDLDTDNFRFLRPEDEKRAREVVEEGFGVAYQKNRIDTHSHQGGNSSDHHSDDETDEGDGNTTDGSVAGSGSRQQGEGGDSSTGGTDGDGSLPEGQAYIHSDLTLFANKGGLVERAYIPNPPAAPTVVDDVSTVVNRYPE